MTIVDRWYVKVPGLRFEIHWPLLTLMLAALAVTATIRPATAAWVLLGLVAGLGVRYASGR